MSREINLRRNVQKIFGIIWGQYSSALQYNIKSITEFKDRYDTVDTIWLVKELKKATSGIDNKSYPVLTLLDSIHTLFSMKQSEAEPNDRYLERFKSNVNTIELAHGEYIFCPTSFVKPVDPNNITAAEKKIECEKMKAALLLRNSDHKRYGALSHRLREGVTLGRNEYPETLSSMYELMVRQRQNNNNNNNRNSISLLQYNNTSNRNR